MSDDTDTLENVQAEETEKPENEVEQPEASEETDQPEGEEPETEDTEDAEEELVEFEFQRKKFSIPSSLAQGIASMRADHTKKTQEAAARQKALDAREAELGQKAEVGEGELKDRAKLVGIEERLAEYSKLTQADWDAHHARDPYNTDRAWRDYQMLINQKGELTKSLELKQTERTQKAQRETAKRLEETEAFARKSIKGWNADLHEKILKNADEAGLDRRALASVLNPAVYKLLHQAYVGNIALSKPVVPKPVDPPKPLNTVSGKSRNSNAPSERDDAETWIKKRNAQLAARR